MNFWRGKVGRGMPGRGMALGQREAHKSRDLFGVPGLGWVRHGMAVPGMVGLSGRAVPTICAEFWVRRGLVGHGSAWTARVRSGRDRQGATRLGIVGQDNRGVGTP